MKKLIVFALVLAMALAIPTAALADTFISSPSTHDAPTLVSAVIDPADWDGEIIVTAFADRDTLPAEEQEKLMTAYDGIKESEEVTDLHDDLAKVAEKLGVTVDKLAVSTLFNIHATKEGIKSAKLTLKSAKFENIVTLLHFNGEDWEIVDIDADGTTITFTATDFSPYAAVVATEELPDSPITGEEIPMGLVALAVLFGVASVCFFAKSKVNA